MKVKRAANWKMASHLRTDSGGLGLRPGQMPLNVRNVAAVMSRALNQEKIMGWVPCILCSSAT